MDSIALTQKVREVVAEAIAIPVESVGENDNLFALGAQSLEMLDIVFKLEQEFNLEITRGEMERAARGDMSEEEFAPNGILSEVGLARLAALMPEAAERIRPGLRASQILSLFTVQTFVRIVQTKLDA